MKTTLDLPDELIKAVKIKAVIQGCSLKDLVADFLRQGQAYLRMHRQIKTRTAR